MSIKILKRKFNECKYHPNLFFSIHFQNQKMYSMHVIVNSFYTDMIVLDNYNVT